MGPLFPDTVYGQEYADTDADPDPDTDIWNSILTVCTMMVEGRKLKTRNHILTFLLKEHNFFFSS